MSIAEFFEPVSAGRISGEIVQQMLALIHSGKLTPGDRLPSERDLAERFGVSRVTVRDALRVLEVMGLVSIRVGAAGGAFVTAPSAQTVGDGLTNLLVMSSLSSDDVIEVRKIVELGILELVLDRATPEDLASLRVVCDLSVASLDTGHYDTSLSNEFHARLASAAHNDAISTLASSFRGPLSMALIRRREPEPERHAQSVREHVQLLKALERKDRVRARRILTRHLTR